MTSGPLWTAAAAWAAGLTCAAVAARHLRKLERLDCPGADELVARARAAAEGAPAEASRALAAAELAETREEAGRMLALATLVPRGMARIALASGTALAVLGLSRYASEGPAVAVAGAAAAFIGGGVGSALAAWFGRRARDRATTSRVKWKRELAKAEARLIAGS